MTVAALTPEQTVWPSQSDVVFSIVDGFASSITISAALGFGITRGIKWLTITGAVVGGLLGLSPVALLVAVLLGA